VSRSWWAAIDMGASSVRLLAGSWRGERLEVNELGRLPNRPVGLPDGLHWDLTGIWGGLLAMLAEEVARSGAPESIGVDGWAVDYGLLDEDGRLLGVPYHYRDLRTKGRSGELDALVDRASTFARTGIQPLEINTLCQLLAERRTPAYDAAATLLLLPDLVCFFLTGVRRAERTNATTTQCLGLDGRWAHDLLDAVGLRHDFFAGVVSAGHQLGALRPALCDELGVDEAPKVVTVASHDTAAAVAALPAEKRPVAYVVAGTWSLVGLELDDPVLSANALAAGFTNEGGVDGTIRFLKNVMGFWLIQECERWWGRRRRLPGSPPASGAWAGLFDPDTPGLAQRAPDMPGRIAAAVRAAGGEVPADELGLVCAVAASLAATYAVVLAEAEALAGVRVASLHLAGGGSASPFLCQLAADATARPVVAGPVEASGIGNLLLQRSGTGELEERGGLRRVVARSVPVTTYVPGAQGASQAAAAVETLARLRGRRGPVPVAP